MTLNYLITDPEIGIVHQHRFAHQDEQIAGVKRQAILRDKPVVESDAKVRQRSCESARAFKGDVLETNRAYGHLRAIELLIGCDGSERHLIGVRTSSWGILWEEK